MTENKKNSFIIYTEYWDCLQGLDHSAIGKIFEAIFKWQRGEDFTITDQATRIGFNFIKSQIERDQKKWEATKKKRSEAGKKGMGSRWENNKGITKDNKHITKDNKGITKITVDVNDNVDVDVDVDVDVLHKCNNNLEPKGSCPSLKQTRTEKALLCEFYFWNFNRLLETKYRVTAKLCQKLGARLKTYTLDEILASLVYAANDKFYTGDNERGWVISPEYHLRNDENVQKFMQKDDFQQTLEEVRQNLTDRKKEFMADRKGKNAK